MKSLMEEASTLWKAIEKGWINAGKPKEFTIKVYEEPEKNFIGMTVKSAKIGIFFTEPQKAEPRARSTKSVDTQRAESQRSQRGSSDHERSVREPRKVEERKEALSPRHMEEKKDDKKEEKREDLGPIWNDEMVASSKEWVTEILNLMGISKVPFTVEPKRFHLRIEFSGSVLENKDKQKHLFAVLSGLIMTMLKRQHKRPLRGYKIVLTEI